MSKLVSMSELCRLTGKGDTTIREKLKSLESTSGPKGSKLFDSKSALALIYQDTDHLSVERAKLTRIQTEKAQLDLDILKGKYIPLEVVCSEVEREYTIIRTQYLALHSRITLSLVNKSDPREISEIIRAEVNEILTELTTDAAYQQKLIEQNLNN